MPSDSKRKHAKERSKRRQRRPASKQSMAVPTGCPLTEHDRDLFENRVHPRLFEKLGAQRLVEPSGAVAFSLWAPNALRVSVIGSFNDWDPGRHPLKRIPGTGIWSGVLKGIDDGALYKYEIAFPGGGTVRKADPFAFACETPPETASRIHDLAYSWSDDDWMAQRKERPLASHPMAIYEMHLGSWRCTGAASGRWLTYRELAEPLAEYLLKLNFTHVELLPPMEHPFYGSWGYQTTGFFAPTSRYGTPQDLMYLIDHLHQQGLGVILDWVPSHFPTDEHGLALFDGTRLFEYPDPKVGYQPDWDTHVFNFGRPQVQSFLISSALHWIERYHIDAIRVDAVASMLYLDYSREEGQWIQNKYGGRENLEAIEFLRRLNRIVHEQHPDVRMIAEESTAWPMVSRPEHLGGLGFDMKWDMGWMHDTLNYMGLDPIHRKYNHEKLTFRMVYAFFENFQLSLSHDEVVHGKSSLIGKMSGDEWQRFANLRALFGYMYGQPGKKLIFMGGEFGQWSEWDHERELDWDLLQYPMHHGLQSWMRDLNQTYRTEPALHQLDFDGQGFRWVDCADSDNSVIIFSRHARQADDCVLVACNFTPVPRENYRLGVPRGGSWTEILNSDAATYGGGGIGNYGSVEAVPMRYHDQAHSLCITLPPLAVLFLKPGGKSEIEDD